MLIRIKPSLVPYVWKGVVLILLGLIIYVAVSTIPLPVPIQTPEPLLSYVSLAFLGLGILGCLVGAVRRNMFTYLISDRDVVVQKQFLRRSVRRIPFTSISDLQVSQTLTGRLMGYGNIAPVTKSGYGLVRGEDRAENVVQEMINVPKPDEVADLIMSRSSTMTEGRTKA